jgi:hypothetical protein
MIRATYIPVIRWAILRGFGSPPEHQHRRSGRLTIAAQEQGLSPAPVRGNVTPRTESATAWRHQRRPWQRLRPSPA